MGGANAGEVAAALAISHLESRVVGASAAAVREAIEAANADVRSRAAADPALEGMGTTCTVALVDGSQVHIAHVGDSRAYLLRDGAVTQLTSDHSLLASMVRDGAIDADDAARDERRNIITRAVGVEDRIDVDVQTIDVQPGDRVLLCSDGVTGMVSDAEIAALGAGDDLEAAVSALIERANEAGGVDNATAIVIEPALVEVPPVEEPLVESQPVGEPPAEEPLVESAPVESAPVVQERSGTRRAWQLLAAALALAVLFTAAYVVTTWLARGA